MQRTETYQDTFLNQARKERTPLTVFLVNGFQMRGIITGFDAFHEKLLLDRAYVEAMQLVLEEEKRYLYFDIVTVKI